MLSGAVLVPVYTDSALTVIPFGVAALGLLLFSLFAPEWQARHGGEVGDVGEGDLDGGPQPVAPPPPARTGRPWP